MQIIAEKRVEFVDPRSAPPDLDEAEKRTRDELDSVRAQLAEWARFD